MQIYDNTSLNSSYNEKCVRQKLYRISKETFYVQFFFFFRKLCHLRDDVEKYCRPGHGRMTIRRTRFVCWITKATDTHSDYVILTAFSMPAWINEHTSMSRYTYSVNLVIYWHIAHWYFNGKLIWLPATWLVKLYLPHCHPFTFIIALEAHFDITISLLCTLRTANVLRRLLH